MNKLFLIFSISLALLATSLAFARPLDTGSIFAPPSNSCAISNACVKSGGSCAGTIDGGNCNSNSTNSTCCGSGLYCVNSTCVVDTVGEWCTSISQCVGMGPFVACVNNSCTALGLPGDECSSTAPCAYASSVCSNSSVCVGKAVNSTCNTNSWECDAGLYCLSNTTVKGGNAGNCVIQLPLNASCNSGSDVCADGNICNVNSTCAVGFQGGNGTKCHKDADCSTDFYCNSNNVCGDFGTWTKTDCTSQSNCSSDAACLCDTVTGEQFCVSQQIESYCGEDLEDYVECVGSHNCSQYYLSNNFVTSTDTLNANSCVSQNCKSDFKKYNSCGCDTSKDVYGNCEQDQYCGGFPLWAIIVIAIVGVILVLVVIVVIVMVMRRRRSYDTIA